MEDLLNQAQGVFGLKKGEILKGVIADIKKKAIFVDIGAKTEGIVIGKELKAVKDFIPHLKVGDEVEVEVKVPESDRGQILLSLKKAATDFAWQFFEEKLNSGGEVEVLGKEESHGGVLVLAPFGLLGFIPGSQIGSRYRHSPKNLIGKKVKVRVLEVDPKKNRLVFSERLASEPEVVEEEQKAIAKLKKGSKFKAKVVRVEPFGIFVRVKVPHPTKKGKKLELEGLVHISEVSWEKVENLTEWFSVGDQTEVVLLAKQDGKLQFSIKRLTPDPWEGIEKKYPKDSPVEGVVTKVTNFGVLVRLEPGIEGLIHISKIPPHLHYQEGEKVSCFIEKIDLANRRLSLEPALKEKPIGYK